MPTGCIKELKRKYEEVKICRLEKERKLDAAMEKLSESEIVKQDLIQVRRTSVQAYTRTRVHVYTRTCVHAYMRTSVHVYMHTCIHVDRWGLQAYTYIYI